MITFWFVLITENMGLKLSKDTQCYMTFSCCCFYPTFLKKKLFNFLPLFEFMLCFYCIFQCLISKVIGGLHSALKMIDRKTIYYILFLLFRSLFTVICMILIYMNSLFNNFRIWKFQTAISENISVNGRKKPRLHFCSNFGLIFYLFI